MPSCTVSIVICTDGRLPFLKTTLRSLRALKDIAFEVIVVCGPTQDGTRSYVEFLRDEIKIGYCASRNLSHSRNIGIGLAAGDIVAFLDDDAVPEPEWLCDLDAAYEDPDVAAAGGLVYDHTGLALQAGYTTIDRLGYPHERMKPTPHLNVPFSPQFPHLLGANSSFRRQDLLNVGGFDEEYEYFLDETDLIARINDAGGRIVQCERAVVHHRYAPSASRNSARVVRHWFPLIKNRVYFGLRNGAFHHTPWEIVRAGLADAELWQRSVEDDVAAGTLTLDDLARCIEEAQAAIAAGITAAQAPQRKLVREWSSPPPFLPFTRIVPVGQRLCIALISQDYPPGHNGGIGRNMAELAQALADMGHDVHVFTRASDRPSLLFEDGVWVHRVVIVQTIPPPHIEGVFNVPHSLWDVSRCFFDEVVKLNKIRRVDFVYAPLWDAEALAFVVDKRFPLVCALQTTMDFWLDSNPAHRQDVAWMRDRGWPLLGLERFLLQQSPLLHANSRALLRDIAKRYDIASGDSRIVLAPHGVADWQQEVLPADTHGEHVRLLFVGRLESRKGIDVLLAAVPDVLRRCPSAGLDIVGNDTIDDSQYKKAFLARADIDDIRDRIVFHGRVDEARLRAFYAQCDVFVAPSRYESFGLIYVEGMMFGKPVIGGRGGGGPEVIEHGVSGMLIETGDVDGLTQAMIALVEDVGLRHAMGVAARQRYETYFTGTKAAEVLLAGVVPRLKVLPRHQSLPQKPRHIKSCPPAVALRELQPAAM